MTSITKITKTPETKELQIENEIIAKLQDLKYAYRPDIRNRVALEANFRQKFEALHQVFLSDKEFARLLEQIISPDIFLASQRLRETSHLERDDGTPLFFTLVNTKDWCKNTFEIINQLRINTDNSYHRYDVILLMNGIPVVQIELKALEINPRRAMQQIVDYKNDAGNGYTRTLMCFMQLFIISNKSNTYYFSNNNNRHFNFDAEERFLPFYQLADSDNKKISHLMPFAEKFLAKCTLGEMISRYMVLVASEQKILVMRPYQIDAVRAIVDCIHQNRGNGYIWHTTGSGKTLTSFKASTLLKDNPDIQKCLFVVDRKDLDRQTRIEFNKFQADCVEENSNTEKLVQRLLSNNYADKVIVTTIQKLGRALDGTQKREYKKRLEPLRNKRIVFIFDECHRSQFGENHQTIKDFFPNSQLFGFTGTPIFAENSNLIKVEDKQASAKTTKDLFQQQLHAYTITHAIEDKNVLRFHIDYFKGEGEGKNVKSAIVDAIFSKHATATNNRKFNALFATACINDAIEYHRLFQEANASAVNPLHIACVFSPPSEVQLQEDLLQEQADNKEAPEEKKAALEAIIASYNARYQTNHRIGDFDVYYQDVQKRMKDQQYPNHDLPHAEKIDVLIVVDMLLTGFDSSYLNTLYVDKPLKHHGLIQAFSRTNRVLNSTKPYGNILDFRQQQKAVDQAIQLFSGEKSDQAREIWLVEAAPQVIQKYETAVKTLTEFMQKKGLPPEPHAVFNLQGDTARGEFINHFKEVQRLKTQLDQYTDLTPEDKNTIENTLPINQLKAFRGVYLETAQRLRTQQTPHKTQDDTIAQLDFEFVLFASTIVDYDYIMRLMSQFSQGIERQAMGREELIALIASDAKLMNEREDITEYINTLKSGAGLSEQTIRQGYENFKTTKKDHELKTLAKTHTLEPAALQAFVDITLQRMILDGDLLTDLFAPLELGWKARIQKELALMQDLIPILKKLAQGHDISGLKAYE